MNGMSYTRLHSAVRTKVRVLGLARSIVPALVAAMATLTCCPGCRARRRMPCRRLSRDRNLVAGASLWLEFVTAIVAFFMLGRALVASSMLGKS